MRYAKNDLSKWTRPGLLKRLQTSPRVKPLIATLGATTFSVGPDVSKWQDYMDWPVTRAAGARFAYIKTTQGNVIKDADAVENFTNSDDEIELRGGYHFLNSSPDGDVQADYMLDFMRDYVGTYGELPPAGDVEVDIAAQVVKDFVYRILERLGMFPVLYTSVGMWAKVIGDVSWAVNCPLWVAHWDVTNPSIPAPWTDYVIHQFTSKGIGSDWGAKSNWIDLNRGRDDWLNLFVPAPPPPGIEPLLTVGVQNWKTPLLSQPNGTKIGEVKLCDALPVTEINGDWYKVEGWIPKSEVK